MKAQPIYATAIGILIEEDYQNFNLPADKVVDYIHYEQICNLVQEYLKYGSIDGRVERVGLRKQLYELTK
jgi:hypothetical protein